MGLRSIIAVHHCSFIKDKMRDVFFNVVALVLLLKDAFLLTSRSL